MRPRVTAARLVGYGPCDALPGLRILQEPLLRPDVDTGVEFVVQDAGPPSHMAMNGRRRPRTTVRPRDAFGVQPLCYRHRRDPGRIPAHDAEHDSCLLGNDFPHAARGDAVTVAQTTRHFAPFDLTEQT